MDELPSRDDVKRVLAAAADVVFSDGVSDGFLEQWTEETMFLLGVRAAQRQQSLPSPRR